MTTPTSTAMPPSAVYLLMNLGSPASPAVGDVRKYLGEFLMDGHVMSVPYLLRLFLVHGIIVPHRSPHSALKYAQIWDAKSESFPLIRIGDALAQRVTQLSGCPAFSVMRYGEPSAHTVLQRIRSDYPADTPIVLLPLYPHYAASSYGTAVEHLLRTARRMSMSHRIRILSPYYKHPEYIHTLAESLRPILTKKPFDKLILNYHAIPLKHLHPQCRPFNRQPADAANNCCTDTLGEKCYRHHCIRTTQLLTEALGLPPNKVETCFQSRIGHVEWLRPYFTERISQLPAEGCLRIVVAAPGFAVDCLETLEEVAEEGKHQFMQAGGCEFEYVPCLNDSDIFAQALLRMAP